MSLSSATRARRNAVGDGRDAGAAGGKSPVTRSNNERARTGLTSQPSKPLSAVCPKARRSNGENSTRLRPTPASRAASASWLVASGPSAQSTMTTSGFCGPLSASRPESRPRARSTLTPASASCASMAWASKGESAMMSARVPSGARRFVASGGGLDRGAFRQPNREGEDGSAAGVVGQRQVAIHQADELTRDRKAKPRALEAARVRAVALLETVENSPSSVRRHARPGVDHGESRRAAFAALNRHADASVIGEFDCVASEVGEDLAQAHAVCANEARRGGAERGGDLDALALGARRQQFHHALGEPTQIDRLDHQIETPGLDLGQIEDFVDQRDQRAPELRIARRSLRAPDRAKPRATGRPCRECR